eukprot:2953879-Prymnesium_polylepis.2
MTSSRRRSRRVPSSLDLACACPAPHATALAYHRELSLEAAVSPFLQPLARPTTLCAFHLA